MNTKTPKRAPMRGAPPVIADTSKAAEAFVQMAPMHVATTPTPATFEAPKAGRPRKYDEPMKPLTIRVPESCYEDLRFLEYTERKSSIQEVASQLLIEAVKERAALLRNGKQGG